MSEKRAQNNQQDVDIKRIIENSMKSSQIIDENGETNTLDRVVALILSEYEDIVFEKPEHTKLSRYFDERSTVEMVKAVECAVEKGYSPQIFKKHLKYLRSSGIQHSPELLKSFFPGELNEVIVDALSMEPLWDY